MDWTPSVAVLVEEGPVLVLALPFLSSANLGLVLSEEHNTQKPGIKEETGIPRRMGAIEIQTHNDQ